MFEFPSMQAAEDFYNGPVYRDLKPVRLASSTTRALFVMEGV
jgi:uncharacterized protein (DUF1330 family)